MRTFDDMLSKQLKDDEFRKEYEAIVYSVPSEPLARSN